MLSNFVHLRAQSSYSMLQSAMKIDDMTKLAFENNMPALALTDNGNLFGMLEFSISCMDRGIQPIHGSALSLAFDNDGKNDFAEILLLAKDKTGYQNLLKLVSDSFIKNDRSVCNHITFADLENYSQGLIALSAYHQGLIGKLLLEKKSDQALSLAKRLEQIFKDRFYFEIMRHSEEQERLIESEYISLASKLDIPLVATNKVLFAKANLHYAHDILLCISQGLTLEHLNRKRASNQAYFKSAKEMSELFADLPSAIENTVNIAKRCYAAAQTSKPILPRFIDDVNVSEEEILKEQTKEGLNKRLEIKFKIENTSEEEREKINSEYFDRLAYELDVICRMGFAGYFLIVSDFIRWSKEHDIAVGPGRGSGAGSVVAWSLLITDLDPIKFGLIFERFLNPERVSMPDFDIDFCQRRRDEVISYVRRKYGDDRVGQIITFGKMQAKAVIKDVARVLGLPYKFADHITELVPFNAVNPTTLSEAIEEVPELKKASMGEGLYNLDGQEELIKQVIDTALVLEGLHRHASVHAAGIVISRSKLVEMLPLYKDINADMVTIQYSMKYAELCGLMKFDFLGLQTLTVISECQKLLKKQGIDIDFAVSNFDDPKTYEMLSLGSATGVFQFESIGMKDTLRRLKPDAVGDLIALGALYRPGPMENIPTYIACKHGKAIPDYLHPKLENILRETYGVIIYQEQVMEIARILAGYSLGKADLLRRAMGKKNKAEMKAQEEEFVKGAVENNISEKQAREIFAIVAKFAGYGFNKAHASAYGIISYQTAYLKANFPTEFLIVCLNLDIDNNDKLNVFLQEARELGIKIIPPSINKSSGYFTIDKSGEEKSICYGLGAIKNVTVNFGEAALSERERGGEFKSIIDFVERIDPKLLNRRLVENLIYAGAFDELHENRNQILASIYPGSYDEWVKNKSNDITPQKPTTPRLLSYALAYHREKKSGQLSLIGLSENSTKVLEEDVPEASYAELAFQEFQTMACFLRAHPLAEYKELLEKGNILNSENLYDKLDSGYGLVKIAGVIQKKNTRMSSRGKFITLQLSDPYGIFDVTIFSDEILEQYSEFIVIKNIVVIECDVYKDSGGFRLTAKSFSPITSLLRGDDNEIHLSFKDESDLERVMSMLKQRETMQETGTKIKISFPFEGSYFRAKIALPNFYVLTPEDLKMIKNYLEQDHG